MAEDVGTQGKGQIVWDATLQDTSTDKSVLDAEREKHQNRYSPRATSVRPLEPGLIGARLLAEPLGLGYSSRSLASEKSWRWRAEKRG